MSAQKEIAKALAAMTKLMPGGERIDASAGDYLIKALSGYDQQAVLDSLNRCFRELKFFPTISEIIDRINDGRPGAEEAWALCPKHDGSAAYLNDEIIEASNTATNLLHNGGDMVSARMVFKEVYERIVKNNRATGKRPDWFLSRAYGPGSEWTNEAALQYAIEKGRIPAPEAKLLLPEMTVPGEQKQIGVTDESRKEIAAIIQSTMKGVG